MAAAPTITITVRDLELDADAREAIEARCRDLAREFPETTHFEITVSQDADQPVAHAHVTGKGTDVAAHASNAEPSRAADQMLNQVQKQLRRVHDKRIFSRRREGRRNPPKKS